MLLNRLWPKEISNQINSNKKRHKRAIFWVLNEKSGGKYAFLFIHWLQIED
jgi:hypothetical protein